MEVARSQRKPADVVHRCLCECDACGKSTKVSVAGDDNDVDGVDVAESEDGPPSRLQSCLTRVMAVIDDRKREIEYKDKKTR